MTEACDAAGALFSSILHKRGRYEKYVFSNEAVIEFMAATAFAQMGGEMGGGQGPQSQQTERMKAMNPRLEIYRNEEK